MKTIYRSKEVDYPYYGNKSYHILLDITDSKRPLQTHVWTKEDGSIDVQAWIPSIKESAESLEKKGWTKVEDAPPSILDVLLLARDHMSKYQNVAPVPQGLAMKLDQVIEEPQKTVFK